MSIIPNHCPLVFIAVPCLYHPPTIPSGDRPLQEVRHAHSMDA
jgi:hypothetical protein